MSKFKVGQLVMLVQEGIPVIDLGQRIPEVGSIGEVFGCEVDDGISYSEVLFPQCRHPTYGSWLVNERKLIPISDPDADIGVDEEIKKLVEATV